MNCKDMAFPHILRINSMTWPLSHLIKYKCFPYVWHGVKHWANAGVIKRESVFRLLQLAIRARIYN